MNEISEGVVVQQDTSETYSSYISPSESYDIDKSLQGLRGLGFWGYSGTRARRQMSFE